MDQVLYSTQAGLEHNKVAPMYQFKLSHAKKATSSDAPRPALTVNMVTGGKDEQGKPLNRPVAHLEHGFSSPRPTLTIKYTDDMLETKRDVKPILGSVLKKEILEIFAEERAMIARQEEARTSRSQTPLSVFVEDREVEIERRQQRSMKYASTYHLTFSLFTPEASPSKWEIEAALAQSIRPLLHALSPICNFTVDTQVQPYAQFSGSVQPVYREANGTWELRSSDLGGFINSAEWPLSPSIGTGPTINFLLYVPSASQMPLTIEGTNSTSWLILQWGGIVIHNPSNPAKLYASGLVTAEELHDPFLTFSQHLLDLLGLPSPDSPFQLRLQSQTRILALRLLSSASSTLGSLARLTQTLTSISIPDTVATSVTRTVSHLEQACADVKVGEFQSALDNARTADEEAEKAFFHKSMVGQVYFPDEHKIAVYLPLLGPVAVPLIMTAIKELKAYLAERKAGQTGTT